MVALTTDQQIVAFDSTDPNRLFNAYFVRNLQPGEQLVGIDYRSSTGEIFGLGSFGNLYTIDPRNGQASMVNSAPLGAILNGTSFGMDFDPFADTLRVVSSLGQNLTVRPEDGFVLSTGNTLGYDAGDILAGRAPNIQAIAFGLSPVAGNAPLYLLDSAHNTLALESPAGSGRLQTEGIVALPALRRFSGFDISTDTGVAYASAEGAQNGLFRIDLASGQAIFLGSIGTFSDNLLFYGLTVVPEPSSLALLGAGLMAAWLILRRPQPRRHA